MTLTATEFLSLFGKPSDDARWMSSADSAEWLERVIYFADKNRRENVA